MMKFAFTTSLIAVCALAELSEYFIERMRNEGETEEYIAEMIAQYDEWDR